MIKQVRYSMEVLPRSVILNATKYTLDIFAASRAEPQHFIHLYLLLWEHLLNLKPPALCA